MKKIKNIVRSFLLLFLLILAFGITSVYAVSALPSSGMRRLSNGTYITHRQWHITYINGSHYADPEIGAGAGGEAYVVGMYITDKTSEEDCLRKALMWPTFYDGSSFDIAAYDYDGGIVKFNESNTGTWMLTDAGLAKVTGSTFASHGFSLVQSPYDEDWGNTGVYPVYKVLLSDSPGFPGQKPIVGKYVIVGSQGDGISYFHSLDSVATLQNNGSFSKIVFKNCVFLGFPDWLVDYTEGSMEIVLENCGLTGHFSSLPNLDYGASSNKFLNATSDHYVTYNYTKTNPKDLIENSYITPNINDNPLQSTISSLNITRNNQGVRWETANQVNPTVSPGVTAMWLYLRRWDTMPTTLSGVTGEITVLNHYNVDRTVVGSNLILGLDTNNINISGSSLNSGSNVKANNSATVSNTSLHGVVTFSVGNTLTLNGQVSLDNGANVTLTSTNMNFDLSRLYTPNTSTLTLNYGNFNGNMRTVSPNLSLTLNPVVASSPSSKFNLERVTVKSLTTRLYSDILEEDKDTGEMTANSKLSSCTFYAGMNIDIADDNRLYLNNCTTKTSSFFTGTGGVIIEGGNYTGNPAITGDNITVKKGVFTDQRGTQSSFIVDADSEASIQKDGNTTITTVKLSNPPIIIDWDDFPFDDFWAGLELDLSAPVISVKRSVADNIPTDKVVLTITAKDPDGHDAAKPISINGEEFVASPATYTVTENQAVNISAVDAKGNMRSYIVYIENIDEEAPPIYGITQSSTTWTSQPVMLTANAEDDIKLADMAYNWTLNPTDGSAPVTTGWQSAKTFRVAKSGYVTLQVKDAMGKISTLDNYLVDNIDYIAPTAQVTYSATSDNPVSSEIGVTVHVNIVDVVDPVTQNSSGLSSAPVMWDSNLGQWVSELERTFHENTSFTIKVKDAVGNISDAVAVNINGVSSSLPVITSFTGDNFGKDFVGAPVTLKVEAKAGADAPLATKAYSWDNGETWTSVSTKKVYENGEYTVLVRDTIGNTTEASYVISNIDAHAPTASIYLYKGPAWDEPDPVSVPVDEYVWKLRIEASDYGSQIDHVETLWNNGTSTTLPIIYDVTEPGVYGAIIVDKAGNEVYVEKVVTAENIGGGSGDKTSGENVNIEVPSTGSAGPDYNASLQDLIFGNNAVFNTVTNTKMNWADSSKRIPIHLIANTKRGTWVTGYVTVDNLRYDITFEGGSTIIRDTSNDSLPFEAHIPFDDITKDMKNGRVKVIIQEWKDEAKTTLVREGSATLYLNVQKSDPALTWTYNRATDELTLAATSTVAGIKGIAYSLDSGASTEYTAPFTVNGASTIIIAAEDRVGGRVQIELDGSDLPLNGSAGGSLPTEGIDEGNDVTSYHVSNKAADIYIIGGTRGNTDAVPSGDVFDFD